MMKNYIRIENITEGRDTRPDEIGINAQISTHLDGVSQLSIVAVLSQLLDGLEIAPGTILACRLGCTEDLIRSDRVDVSGEVLSLLRALAEDHREDEA